MTNETAAMIRNVLGSVLVERDLELARATQEEREYARWADVADEHDRASDRCRARAAWCDALAKRLQDVARSQDVVTENQAEP